MSRRCSLPTQSRIVVLAYRLPALSSFSFLLSPFSLISILLPCLSFRVVNRSRWLNALWLFGLQRSLPAPPPTLLCRCSTPSSILNPVERSYCATCSHSSIRYATTRGIRVFPPWCSPLLNLSSLTTSGAFPPLSSHPRTFIAQR